MSDLFLQLTDGTTTITIADGSGGAGNYRLLYGAWAPTISGYRQSELGGRGPYEDAIEEFRINIYGSSAADAYSKLSALAVLMNQVDRWARGENVSAVLIKYSPNGASVSSPASPLQAALIGRPGGAGGDFVNLTPEFHDVTGEYIIRNVRVRFVRIGEWLNSSEVSDASTATNNGDLVTTIDLGAAVNIPSPTRFTLSNFNVGQTASFIFYGGYLLVAEVSTDIAIFNAESLGTGAPWSSVADTAANARNSNVLRYTPTVTTEVASPGTGVITMNTAADLVAVFANIRNSTTVDFTVRAMANSSIYNQFTPLIAIPAAATQRPLWYMLGILAKVETIENLYLYIKASAASSSLDIDTIVLANYRAVHIVGYQSGLETLNSAIASGTLDWNHQRLTKPEPKLALANRRVPYSDNLMLYTKAQALTALLLATGGGTGAAGNEWRQANTSTDAVLQNTWTAIRRTAYLTPQ